MMATRKNDSVLYGVVAGTAMGLLVALATGAANGSSTSLSAAHAIGQQTSSLVRPVLPVPMARATIARAAEGPAHAGVSATPLIQSATVGVAAPHSTFQVTGTLCALALGVAAMGVFVRKVLTSNKSEEESLLHVALAATTGKKDRPLWIPGSTPPAHLTGEYPGDYGYDPLNMSADPADFERYREAEVLHGRWAMLGIVGCLAPELMAKAGLAEFPEPVWFKSGAKLFDGGIDYLGNPDLVHAQNAAAILFFQLILMGTIEAWRWNSPETRNLDRTYPGGPFDPMGMASDEMKLKELKNGRLAMVSIVGYYVQAWYTGEGPVANWLDHLANPFGNNITSTLAMF